MFPGSSAHSEPGGPGGEPPWWDSGPHGGEEPSGRAAEHTDGPAATRALRPPGRGEGKHNANCKIHLVKKLPQTFGSWRCWYHQVQRGHEWWRFLHLVSWSQHAHLKKNPYICPFFESFRTCTGEEQRFPQLRCSVHTCFFFKWCLLSEMGLSCTKYKWE